MVWLPKTERGRSAGEFSSKTCARRAEGLETVGCQCAIITIHSIQGLGFRVDGFSCKEGPPGSTNIHITPILSLAFNRTHSLSYTKLLYNCITTIGGPVLVGLYSPSP